MKASWARSPASRRATSSASVASPQPTRCGPRSQTSPRCVRGSLRGLERGVEIEVLDALALLADLERAQQLVEFGLIEARQREVEVFDGLQVGEEACQQLLVPMTGDPVQGDVQQPCLLEAEVDQDCRDGLQPEPAGGEQALVAADDRAVLAPRDDRVKEAELADRARQRLEFGVGDAARVRRVGAQ